MLIVPVHKKVTAKNFPTVTFLLVLANCLVFFLFQTDDEQVFEEAIDYYFESRLPEIELPRYQQYLKDTGDSPSIPFLVQEAEAQLCERIVQDAGVEWTVIRASWFNQNFSEGEFLGMVLDGAIALPASDIPEPFVDVDDIADVAVAALTEDGHNGEIYEVTGPRMLTFTEAAREISRAAGRNANVCDGVQRALGRAPTDFAEFARRTAASGVWEAT